MMKGLENIKKVIRLLALGTGRFYPQEVFLVLISVRACTDLRIMSMKHSMTPSAMEPATFQLVAQCLDQLLHSVVL